MAINLQKGETIVLDKAEYDLSLMTMGLGWDVRKSVFGKAFDLDAYAILLGADDKLLANKDLIYYANLRSHDGTVAHSGDNLTGAGQGDDEQISIRLSQISDKYQKIILGVSIYEAKARNQHFGMVENAFVRAIDAKGVEIARYSLSGDDSYAGKISMLMGAVYRRNGEWKFRALGNALEAKMVEVVGSFSR